MLFLLLRFLLFFLVAVAFLESVPIDHAIAGDCPLDMSQSNLTLTASICSDQNERAKCCRYINAAIAVSVAHYTNSSGELGVPSTLSDICLTFVSDTLESNGVPPIATTFCGLGPKIQVSYQCEGMHTVSEMLQTPNFDDVIRNCKMPLSLDSRCKRCLNSGLSYLRHLVGEQDNVTLNTCRDAAFVALANQGGNFSAIGIASCFFSVDDLIVLQGNSPESSFQSIAPATSPSPVPAPDSAQQFVDTPLKEHHHSYQLIWIPGIGIAITGLAILLLIILILLIRKKNRELKSENAHTGSMSNAFSFPQANKSQQGASTMFRRFSYKEIKTATNIFSTIIGTGLFGIIYKAQLDDGLIAVVKEIKNVPAQSEEDFCREMELLGKLHHRHLVTFKGFCFLRQERFMIYEFMENGSLRDQLIQLHSSGRTPLTWHTRIQVAIDVANALEYLHFYCDPPIFHGDIKSSNILLDKNFMAKVADFGILHSSRSECTFSIPDCDAHGTPSNMDPEFLATQVLTDKSDVYSYGVLLLELITGKEVKHNDTNLVELSQDVMDSNYRLTELIDPAIADSFDLAQLRVVVGIVKLCIRRGVERPSIKQVLRMLYVRLDPMLIGFGNAIDNEEDYFCGGRTWREKKQENEVVIPFSSDAKGLQSSSSTTRSYCSRSVLFESTSPQSPPNGIFSV